MTNIERAERICVMRANGYPYSRIAAELGISRQRAAQIYKDPPAQISVDPFKRYDPPDPLNAEASNWKWPAEARGYW